MQVATQTFPFFEIPNWMARIRPVVRTGYHFVLVQDSLEGPLCPFALIAVTS
jgi:hypothetical protein